MRAPRINGLAGHGPKAQRAVTGPGVVDVGLLRAPRFDRAGPGQRPGEPAGPARNKWNSHAPGTR